MRVLKYEIDIFRSEEDGDYLALVPNLPHLSAHGLSYEEALKEIQVVQTHYPLDREQMRFLRNEALRGYDIVDGVVRLCTMNLYLHGIGGDNSLVEAQDSLQRVIAT